MYILPKNIDKNKIFIVQYSEIENRLDPIYYLNKVNFLSFFKYPLVEIKKYFFVKDGDHDKLPPEEISDPIDGKRYLRAQDIKDGVIEDKNSIYISNSYFQKIKRCHIYPNDLLISIMASLGLNAIVPEDFPICTANRAVGILRNKTDNHLLTKYLQILIDTRVGFRLFEIEKKGGIQQRLNLSDLGNVKIPLPPLEVQEQIVDVYREAYTQKQRKEAKAKALLESIDVYLLTELGITLSDKDNSLAARIFTTKYSEVIGNRLDAFYYLTYFKDSDIQISKGFYPDEYLYLNLSCLESGSRPSGGVSNIEEGILSFGGEHVNSDCEVVVKNPKYIPYDYHNKIRATETKLNDILIVKDGATTGKVGIIKNKEYVGQNINEHVFLLRTNQNLNSNYLAYLLHSPIGQIQISQGITGATVTGITKEVVRRLKIPIPPIEKQNEIAKYILSIRAQAKALQGEAKNLLQKSKIHIEQMILG